MSTDLIQYTSINDFIKNCANKITKDKFRYCKLSSIEAKQKCNEIEHSDLSFDEKIEEFDAIGYSRTYDLIGGSYYLQFHDSIIIYTLPYYRKDRKHTFYKPNNFRLPSIELYYDFGW